MSGADCFPADAWGDCEGVNISATRGCQIHVALEEAVGGLLTSGAMASAILLGALAFLAEACLCDEEARRRGARRVAPWRGQGMLLEERATWRAETVQNVSGNRGRTIFTRNEWNAGMLHRSPVGASAGASGSIGHCWLHDA